jgi:glycosyltransferase involved in cell wall biosynthesis
MEIKKLSIIIPAYNEEKTIGKILEKVSELVLLNSIEKEIIVINDCSTDKTAQIIEKFIVNNEKFNIVSFHHEINMGKGVAIRKGIATASGDYIVIQDADLELNPSEINTLLREVIVNKSKIVYGSRFLISNHENTSYLWHIIGNKFLTKLTNLLSGLRLTDMMTCYKLIPKEIMISLTLKENRFGFEPEVTMKLAKIKGLKIKEVPISYVARSQDEGKKIKIKAG